MLWGVLVLVCMGMCRRGYHVVAPDLRGYNLSSKPEGIRAYGKDPVLSDVTALLDHCGGPDAKAALVSAAAVFSVCVFLCCPKYSTALLWGRSVCGASCRRIPAQVSGLS